MTPKRTVSLPLRYAVIITCNHCKVRETRKVEDPRVSPGPPKGCDCPPDRVNRSIETVLL
jgi:hypothetical protein